jgi:hypothetical protein
VERLHGVARTWEGGSGTRPYRVLSSRAVYLDQVIRLDVWDLGDVPATADGFD